MAVNNKQIISNPRTGEQYTRIKHSSGCTVCLCHMPLFTSTHALFGCKYGSIDSTFKTNRDNGYVTVPEGIAHFLEHKLFENEECDAFKLYAETGANANAYTSFDKTAYLFTCTGEFRRNLEILLDFVQKPYFTDETVQKEQGIIAQEIKMYDDDPNWRVFFNALEAVYHNNPVRINIAGTTDSIAKIDKDLLYRCYNTFYNLNNMVLSIAGDFGGLTEDEVLEICDRLLIPAEDIALESVIPDEPYEVQAKTALVTLPVGMPLFQIMFKLPNSYADDPAQCVKHNIMLEMALGKSSAFYNSAYESGLINETFSVSVFDGRGFFVCIIDGEAREPERVYAAVCSELKRLKQDGLCEKDFARIKKQTYGEFVGHLTSVESVASSMLNAELSGIDMNAYTMLELAAAVGFDDIVATLTAFDVDNAVLSVCRGD